MCEAGTPYKGKLKVQWGTGRHLGRKKTSGKMDVSCWHSSYTGFQVQYKSEVVAMQSKVFLESSLWTLEKWPMLLTDTW